jgi:membrane-bound inhibitor of C-type lysozyme
MPIFKLDISDYASRYRSLELRVPSNPLTHHEILKLIEPFTRRGFHADLAASNRIERKLVFKPVERPIELPHVLSLRERLQLENVKADTYRLTRTLTYACDENEPLEARLATEGESLVDLLASIEAVAPQRQFGFGAGYIVAKNYFISGPEEARQDLDARTPRLCLTHMVAQLNGLSIAFTAPTVKGDPEGLIELMPRSADFIKLPEDLLAVLGLNWGLLVPKGNGWKTRLLMRGKEPQRSLRTELKIEQMMAHVAQTLAETPARFHERLVAARWRVVLRRAIPLVISLLLIGGAFATSSLHIAEDSQLRMLVLNAPPVLLVLFFCMREIPSIEIPPVPRRLKAAEWQMNSKPLPSQSQSSGPTSLSSPEPS